MATSHRLVAGTGRLEGRPHADRRRRLERRPRRAPAGARRIRRHAGRDPEAGRHGPRARRPLARALREHPQSEACSRSSSRGCGIRRSTAFPRAGRRPPIARSSPAPRWASTSSRPATARCSRSPIASSTGCARRCSRRAGSATGGRTGCCRPRIRSKQKMALLWHGHFATHENKVRDYRKMMQQIDLFERGATGNLRDLTIKVAQNPAMLYFLDAQYNVKGAPNENFAREVMELFTMGVGNYTEKDVRECARAFTGWYFDDLAFKIDPAKHDDGAKTFLGRTGNFDGVEVLKIIFEQPVTAEFLAAKIYRFLVRDELSPELRKKLGAVLRTQRLRGQAAADGDPLVEGLLQPGQLRRPHQGAGRALRRDDEAARRRRNPRRARLQPVDDRDGPAPAQPALGGRLGGRQGVDHAGPADRPRQRRARRADPRHDRLPRLELRRRQRRRARQPAARRLRHRRRHRGQRSGEDEHVRHGRARARRAVQHAHLRLHRLAAGGAQADSRRRATRREFDLTQMVLESDAKTTAEAVDYLLWRMLRVPPARATRDAFVDVPDQGAGHRATSTGPGPTWKTRCA